MESGGELPKKIRLIYLIYLQILKVGYYCLPMSNHLDGFGNNNGIDRLAWEPLLTPSLSALAPSGKTPFGAAHGESDWSAGVAKPAGQAAGAGAAGQETGENKIKAMAAKKKEKMEMPVCTRVSVSTFRTLDIWCDNSFRKRSEVIGLLLERVVEIIGQQHCIDLPVEEFARSLCLGPKP